MPPSSCIRYIGLAAYLRAVWHFIVARLLHLFWRTETISAEISFGLIAIGWSIVLFLSNTFSVGNLYAYLERWTTQEGWAIVMAGLGSLQLLLAAFIPMASCRLMRVAIWLASLVLWSYIAWVAVLAVPVTTAAAAYGTLAVGSLWAFLRAGEGR